MAVLLDTSVLIAAERGPDEDAAISVVSLTELHFGVLVAPDDDARAHRMRRLAIVEDRFDALPFNAEEARECGRLHAAVRRAEVSHAAAPLTSPSPRQPTSTACLC